MRKINGKLFLLLLLGGLGTIGGLFAVHYFQYKRVARALLYQARRAEEQDQKTRSARYLQRYLEFVPRDTAEKANLAKLFASDAYPPGSKQRRAAIDTLDTVLRAEDNPELRRLLVKIALEQMQFQLAQTHLEQLLRWKDVENLAKEESSLRKRGKALPDHLTREDRPRGELEGYWGQIKEADKKPIEAIDCYRLAVRHAPQTPVNGVRLAYLLRRQNESDPLRRKQNVEEADRVIDEMVGRNTVSYEAYLGRWRYRRDFDLMAISEAPKGKIALDAAAEDVAQALKRQPDAIDVILAAADLERLRGRVAAEDPQKSPQERRAALMEHRKRALEQLQRGQDLVSKNKISANDYGAFQLLWHRGNLLLDEMDLERARREEERLPPQDDAKAKEEVARVITRVRKSQMPAAADYMEGRLLVQDRRWADAAALFERSRVQLESQRDLACQANLYLGQCYERLEEPTQMYNAFKRVIDFDPNSVPALLGMAAARWSQGQLDNALSQYQMVLKQKRIPTRILIDIARLELQRQVTNAKPDWTQMEKLLEAAEAELGKDNLEVTLLRAERLMRENKADEARQLLTAARDKKPQEVEYWTALVDLDLRLKKYESAQKTLEGSRKTLEDRVSLRLVEARLLSARDGKKANSALAALADRRDSFSAEDQARLLTGLADTLYRAGGIHEARTLWQAMAQLPRQRTDLRLQLLLFDLAMRENDEPGMKQTLADIRNIEQSSGAYHRYGQALHLIWQAKRITSNLEERNRLLTQARQQLDGVLAQRPSWQPVFLARAEIAEIVGNQEQAIKDLQEALKGGEGSPSILRRLAALLSQRGRETEAQFLLARVQKSVLYSTDLGRMAVSVAIRQNELGRAVEMMREAVRDDTRDWQDLVWMARVLMATDAKKHAGEAEKRLREALVTGAAEEAPWLAMVQFLVGQKRRDEALATIAQAKEKLPPARAPLALARCHDAIGQPKEALQFYDQAVKANPNDPAILRAVAMAHMNAKRSRAAEPLLRKLIGGEATNVAQADLDWARRAMALLLASGTDYRRFTEALGMVGLELDESGRLSRDKTRDESTENRRVRARVLASQNQRQFRQRAIEILEELGRTKALSGEDEFILALLYEAEGDARKSQERLRTLTQPQLRTPQYLAHYAMSLIVQRRLPDALDEAEKVIGWLAEIERQREMEPNTFASVELKARVLEARGKGEEAAELVRKHIAREKAKPDEVVLLLGSLSRQKRYKDAFALCEKTWQEGKCMPEAVGGVSVALLRVMNPTDSEVASVEKHLKAAIEAKPESTVLLMHLSDLYDRRGQYDRAAATYREVLKREPNNIVALNNLAWLLAHRAGDARLALEYVNQAVTGMGRRADLLDTRGLVYLALKDTPRALEDLKAAVHEAPTPQRLYHLAKAHHEERDAAKARATLTQAKEKGLVLASLHPVEQDSARRLLEEYGIR